MIFADPCEEKVETPAEPQLARAQGGTSAPPEAREVPLGEAGRPPKRVPKRGKFCSKNGLDVLEQWAGSTLALLLPV